MWLLFFWAVRRWSILVGGMCSICCHIGIWHWYISLYAFIVFLICNWFCPFFLKNILIWYWNARPNSRWYQHRSCNCVDVIVSEYVRSTWVCVLRQFSVLWAMVTMVTMGLLKFFNINIISPNFICLFFMRAIPKGLTFRYGIVYGVSRMHFPIMLLLVVTLQQLGQLLRKKIKHTCVWFFLGG